MTFSLTDTFSGHSYAGGAAPPGAVLFGRAYNLTTKDGENAKRHTRPRNRRDHLGGLLIQKCREYTCSTSLLPFTLYRSTKPVT